MNSQGNVTRLPILVRAALWRMVRLRNPILSLESHGARLLLAEGSGSARLSLWMDGQKVLTYSRFSI